MSAGLKLKVLKPKHAKMEDAVNEWVEKENAVISSSQIFQEDKQYVFFIWYSPGQKHAPRTPDPGSPTCPSCGEGMVKRNRRADGKPFWGCVGFPVCTGVVKIDDAFVDAPDDDIPF
jgi:hypothetical protein